jgi:hypothetical protein
MVASVAYVNIAQVVAGAVAVAVAVAVAITIAVAVAACETLATRCIEVGCALRVESSIQHFLVKSADSDGVVVNTYSRGGWMFSSANARIPK